MQRKTQPLSVTQTAIEVRKAYKENAKHIALVADEYGGIVGLVTVHDIMQAIVSDLPSLEERVKPAATKRDDGGWLAWLCVMPIQVAPMPLDSFVPEPRSDRRHRFRADAR